MKHDPIVAVVAILAGAKNRTTVEYARVLKWLCPYSKESIYTTYCQLEYPSYCICGTKQPHNTRVLQYQCQNCEGTAGLKKFEVLRSTLRYNGYSNVPSSWLDYAICTYFELKESEHDNRIG